MTGHTGSIRVRSEVVGSPDNGEVSLVEIHLHTLARSRPILHLKLPLVRTGKLFAVGDDVDAGLSTHRRWLREADDFVQRMRCIYAGYGPNVCITIWIGAREEELLVEVLYL